MLWQVWAFVAPGLYQHEKKVALPFTLSSVLLFAGGATFCHLVVMPAAYNFFLGYAENWAVNVRPEFARLQTNTDPHPLPRFRANGPLSNIAEFAKAFGCKKGDAMVRENVCKIW